MLCWADGKQTRNSLATNYPCKLMLLPISIANLKRRTETAKKNELETQIHSCVRCGCEKLLPHVLILTQKEMCLMTFYLRVNGFTLLERTIIAFETESDCNYPIERETLIVLKEEKTFSHSL